MAMLFMDSFDHYEDAEILQKWTTMSLPFGGTFTIGATDGRNGGGAMVMGGSQLRELFLTVAVGTATTGVFGCAYKNTSLGQTTWPIVRVWNGATLQLQLMTDFTGRLYVYRNTTLLGTSATAPMRDNIYTYVEMKWTIHDSTGAVTVRANNETVLTLTGQDTLNSGAAWTGISLGGAAGNVGGVNYWDDMYLLDTAGSVNNDFLGPIRIKVILPDGAGNSTDFTPSAGSNFQNVDETSTDSDTTYNSETTAGDHDTYTYAAVGLTGNVRAIQTNLVVRSTGAGAETLRPKIRISGTDYSGTTVGCTTSYLDKMEVFETSPATAVVWTVSEIDGAEFGIELVS